MVANFSTEHASRGYEYKGPVENLSPSRHYDSFIVRLWQDEGSDAMLRVEVQHVQAGLSFEGVQVPLDWIVPGILGCLQSPADSKATPRLNSEDAN
jgi:hypothetical protein